MEMGLHMMTLLKKILVFGFALAMALPLLAQLPEVRITITEADKAQLERDPLDGPDVLGDFVGGDGVLRAAADINYRGAWQLSNLINQRLIQRNWKVKMPKDNDYRERREWNYNYEEHPRQVMGYLLMNKAGVPAPSCRHVILYVNDVLQGLYVEYEDPDNKKWLTEKFGDNDGDLYKAALDKPKQQRYFGTLEYLGDQSSDYFLHYDKKTNNNDEAEFDYSSLMAFTQMINSTPDEEVLSTYNVNIETQAFIKYLVVANFISNWDSYPMRPKNYWLYQNPTNDKWSFIPWDVDATFQPSKRTFNQMGDKASIFYQLLKAEAYGAHPEEGNKRPLARRMMEQVYFRDAYVREYDRALNSYLKEGALVAVLDSLRLIVVTSGVKFGIPNYNRENDEIKAFIKTKTASVLVEIATYAYAPEPIVLGQSDLSAVSFYPNPASESIVFRLAEDQSIRGEVFDLSCRVVKQFASAQVAVKDLRPGTYMVKWIVVGEHHVERLIIR
jgi:hypothetical protein